MLDPEKTALVDYRLEWSRVNLEGAVTAAQIENAKTFLTAVETYIKTLQRD